jgi:hypothetical protein
MLDFAGLLDMLVEILAAGGERRKAAGKHRAQTILFHPEFLST